MDPSVINFNVLRRHDPRISSILDSTSYAVIYRYLHGAWSKTGFEGTLFIFQRDTHPFNGVFVLNRQGLDNLCEGLLARWDVDLDEGLIIWRSAGATGDADDDIIYGIWVYEEKDRARIATTMQELINRVSAPLHPPSTPSPPPVSLSHPVPRVPIISAGQTISLDQLFGVGSVCSEPPPLTSALPHPPSSMADPEEPSDSLLPAKILSPDASDLPKGMQLLDSLFQKAAIKTQKSNHPSPNLDSLNRQPHSIQQLLAQSSAFTSKAPLQISPAKPNSSKTKRDRHQSSTAHDTYKNQTTTVPQSTQSNHRAVNPAHTSRSDYRSWNHSNNNSRRSSGGSSSRSRNDQPPLGHHPSSQSHQHAQLVAHLNASHHPSLVAAPAPVENSNAEARHNILSLLGHPAASQQEHAYSSPTRNLPNSILASPSAQATLPLQETTEHHSNHPRSVHHPESLLHPPNDPLIHSRTASHSESQAGSQQPSPHSNAQPTYNQLPNPSPSYANFADPSPPRAPQINSATHSPHGPRPQADTGHHHHSPKNPSSGSPSSAPNLASNMTPTTGPIFSTSVWPFNKSTPNRALSPFNPARQSPSHFNHHQKRPTATAVSVNYRQSNNHHHARNFPHSQQRDSADHTPPEINDSSRPVKPDVLPTTVAHNTNQKTIGISSPNQTNHEKVTAINPKLAVQSLDEVLILGNNLSTTTTHQVDPSNNSSNQQSLHLNTLNQPDLAPLDKAQFVNGILDLIHNHGPFVDTLYARYLARYAEKYL